MLEVFKDADFQKRLLWLQGLLPALFLAMDFWNHNLGANPPEAIIRTTGIVSMIFLVLTLLVTPVATIFKQAWLPRHRRWLGLWCFYYSVLHLFSYSVFDKALEPKALIEDIGKRPFILLGFLGFLILVPLAITSSNSMIRRLGGVRWKKLHRLIYLIPPIVVAHFWLIVKSDIFYPALFALTFSILLGYRLFRSSFHQGRAP